MWTSYHPCIYVHMLQPAPNIRAKDSRLLSKREWPVGRWDGEGSATVGCLSGEGAAYFSLKPLSDMCEGDESGLIVGHAFPTMSSASYQY